MAADGMWSLRTNVVGQPSAFVSGGVVILDAGRIFGGDGAIAYLGTFTLTDDRVAGEVRIWHWNPARSDVSNVFGLPSPIDLVTTLAGTLLDDRIDASLSLSHEPGAAVRARLVRIADVPAARG